MSTEILLHASTIINRPILEVFNYVGDPQHLPEWVPFYSSARPAYPMGVRKGQEFRAFSPCFGRWVL
jgi:uncharacterized protein YndB with AHSA1/START domain